MAIKKKGAALNNTKEINKPNEDRNKILNRKKVADKQTIAASSDNLRVTGATVSGIPDTASVPIQCTVSEDNYDSDAGIQPEAAVNQFDSDSDGFVVRRLLKAQQKNDDTENQSQDFATAAVPFTFVNPPPTAPRSSPTNEPLPRSYSELYNRK